MILTFLMRVLALFASDRLSGYETSPPPFDMLRKLGYTTARLVHAWAKIQVGRDLSTIVNNDVACAESVSRILRAVDPSLLPGVITGTATLDDVLAKSPRFKLTTIPSAGCVVVSPTGKGNGTIPNGHVGIVGDNVLVYSNSSVTGEWSQNFTLSSWYNRYVQSGKYPMKFYKIID